MRDYRAAPMQLGDRAQVDGERQMYLLSFTKAETRRADEDTRGRKVDGSAEATLSIRQQNVDRRACSVAGMQSSFHSNAPVFPGTFRLAGGDVAGATL